MLPCPCCDGRGCLRHIPIGPQVTEGFLYDECDALWLRREDFGIARLIADPQGRGCHD